MKSGIQKLCTAGLLVALGIACSAFYIPVGASKCFPVQHMINVLVAVLLGPVYGTAMAFATSLLRVATGTGSLLAFPGSMIGAFCSALFYRRYRRLSLAFAGEAAGTGVLGALAAWPVAVFLMGKQAAMFAYIIPFILSSATGAGIAVTAIGALRKTRALDAICTAEKKTMSI